MFLDNNKKLGIIICSKYSIPFQVILLVIRMKDDDNINTDTDYTYTVRMEAGKPVRTTHSETCLAVTGYTSREFAESPYLWIQMVPAEDRDLVLQQIEHTYSLLSPQPVEHRIRRKDGTVRWVESIVLPNQNESGSLVSYTGIIRDINERRKKDDELRESEERFRLAATVANDLVYDFDIQSETMRLFGDIKSCLGYDPDNFPKTLKSWLGSIHPDDIRKVMETYTGCVRTGENGHFDYRILGKDGTYRHWEEHVTPIFAQKGQLLKWIGAITDITEHKKTEKELHDRIKKLESIDNGQDTLPS